MRFFLRSFALAMGIVSAPLQADFAKALQSNEPLGFEAEGGLEWNRARQTYQALGGVVLRKSTLTAKMDKLYAAHQKNGNVERITAEGNVTATSEQDTLKADKVVYSPIAETVTLSGDVLLGMPGQSLQTKGSILYDQRSNRITSNSRTTLKKNDTQLTADSMTVDLIKQDNSTAVQQAIAEGNVVIATQKERITGNRAVYTSATQQATLTGNVVIQRENNKITGTKAMVNLASGVSTLTNESGNKRVKGILQLP